jgi:phage recombination protein Bet
MPNKQLTVAPIQAPEITKEKVAEYLDAFGLSKELSENEKKQFIEIACEFKLNPFKREIFCVPYGQGDSRKLSIITGYEVYIKRAERSGKLNGWKAWTEGTGEDLKAVVEIYRKDWDKPFQHEVYWKESVQKKRDGTLTSFWIKQPRFQLKKVAISQAFRLCFPDELAGIPYDADELPEEMVPDAMRDVTPQPQSGKGDLRSTASEPSAPTTRQTGSRTSTQRASQGDGGNGGKSAETSRPAASPVSQERQSLIDQINRLISTNAISFPAAHVRWVQSQLKQSPSLERLKEILAHLASALSTPPDTAELPAAQSPEASESEDGELLF